jgi:hypothetical protein
MIISHAHKFIFFCNSKTGSTSVDAVFYPYAEADDFNKIEVPWLYRNKHIPPYICERMLPRKIWKEYFKFTFVRNPWDWFVSQYHWNLWAQEFEQNRVEEYVPVKSDIRLQAVDKFTPEHIYTLFNLMKEFRGLPDTDSLYQCSYVYDPDGNQMVDYVGRFEDLLSDTNFVCQHLDLPQVESLKHANRTDHRHYTEYYDDETRALIGDLYACDIEAFGYEFE